MPRRKSRKNPTYAVTYHIGGGRFQTVTLDADNEYEATIEAKERLSPFAVGIPDVREVSPSAKRGVSRARKNPSAARAKAQRWAMPRNAGPYLPEMYPYGVGGVPASYAVGNPEEGKYSDVLSMYGPDGFGIPEKAPFVGSFPVYPISRARYALTLIGSPSYDGKPEERARIAEAVLRAHPELEGQYRRMMRKTVKQREMKRYGRRGPIRLKGRANNNPSNRIGRDGLRRRRAKLGSPEQKKFTRVKRNLLSTCPSPCPDWLVREVSQLADQVVTYQITEAQARTRLSLKMGRPLLQKRRAKDNPPRDSKGRFISTRRARKNTTGIDQRKVARMYRKLMEDPDLDDRKIEKKIYRLAEQVVAGQITEAQARLSVRSLLTDYYAGPIPDPMQDMRLVRIGGRGRNYRPRYAKNNPPRDAKGRFVKRRRR